MRNTLFCLLVFNALSYSAIRHYQDTLWLSSCITYQSENSLVDSINSYDNNVLKCNVNFSGDLFFYPEKMYTCICFIDTFAIGSSKPFYVSKKSIDSIAFTSNLDVNNSDLFSKVDTFFNDPKEPASCVRPHIHAGKNDRTFYPIFLIIKANSGYVLISYQILWSSFEDIELGTIKFYRKIVVDSYLQDDGSLNFSEIPLLLKTNIRPNSSVKPMKDNIIAINKYYDLKGREISIRNSGNGVFLFKNRRHVAIRQTPGNGEH